ncbi:19031_t:CDS:2 [Gigaspora margarita]|uniref:19031_t:CDS:1 n=1 Tax=Gigaspora margarita TaxID=4874 RepID=A0ABN7WDN9_GIGMA|nr:19031_t:CDS:2 [Gigaspora margarita]
MNKDNELGKKFREYKSAKEYYLQSKLTTKTNDADLSNCITFRINKMNMLNDTIENIKFQLKELRVLFEVSVKEGLECHYSEEDLDDKNKSDPDDYRINEIQQGIDIDKEKLKNKMITIVFNQ